jgi:hypothetical protein
MTTHATSSAMVNSVTTSVGNLFGGLTSGLTGWIPKPPLWVLIAVPLLIIAYFSFWVWYNFYR